MKLLIDIAQIFSYSNDNNRYSVLTCLDEASRVFNNFPRNGNTPYLSRPTTESPETASALAESPSVKIKVQSLEFLVPASLASSSLGIPLSLECLDAEHFLDICAYIKEI